MSNAVLNMLVADKSPAIHQLIERAVAAHSGGPIQYIRVDNERECMDALANGRIDLALVDVCMQEMPELEALDNAQLMRKGTFVVLMSDRPNERAFELARQLKAYEFLVKPFGTKSIEAILESYRGVCRHLGTLIIDDSVTTRKIIRRVLERSVFRMNIEEAEDGTAGVDLCRTGASDIAFLNYHMPGLNGIDTLDRLREHNPNIKVIIVSPMKGGWIEQQALEHGAAAFLYKPFYPNDVDAILHRIFGLRSPRLMVLRSRILKRFDVSIVNRTVEVTDKTNGHAYRFLWFREAPHLRGAHVVPNACAKQGVSAFRAEAEKAAIFQLHSTGLLDSDVGYTEVARRATTKLMQAAAR
jgi:DNA-binding NtrC family response regulator